jgi:hypothetical protein
MQLPVAWDRDIIPAAGIIIELVEISGAMTWLSDPVELPYAVERLVKR